MSKTTAAELARKNQKFMIYALLDRLKIKDLKDDLVSQYTNMRTTHTSDMVIDEASELIKKLRKDLEDKVKPIRGKIIYYLCMYGMKTPDDKPDYKRINEFIQGIGSRNPEKRPLYDLWPEEALSILNQVEAMVKKNSRKQNSN